MLRVGRKEFAEAVEQHGEDTGILAEQLNLSRGSICLKLRQYKQDKEIQRLQDLQKPVKVEHIIQEQENPKDEEIKDNTTFDIMSFIPPQNDNGYYKERDIDNAIQFWVKAQKQVVALYGESGGGKTEATIHFARANQLPLLIIPCDDTQVLRELLGFWQAKNGSTEWHDGLLSTILRIPCVVLFDEVNCLPSSRLFMLHELFQNRRLFVKDAPADKSIINLHDEAHLLMAMNPYGPQYSATNRLNCALANRCVFIEVPAFKIEDMGISTGKENLDKQIIAFYNNVQEAINKQNLRIVISLRNINRIVDAIKNGATVKQAVVEGFINSAISTAGKQERDALMNIAITIFGPSTFNESRASEYNYNEGN